MRRFIPLLLLTACAAGCAGAPPGPPAPDAACIVFGPDMPPPNRDPRVAVLLEPVKVVDAPWPYSTHPTLLETDCVGRILPGLADITEGEGRRYVLELNDDARDYHGTRITAQEVVRLWQMQIARGVGVDSVRAMNDYRLEVFLERPAPMTLVSAVFGVPARGRIFDFIQRSDRAGWTSHGRELPRPGRPPQDPIDELQRADLMVVGDPAVAEYATGAGMTVAALPYTRTYLLVAPSTRGRRLSNETLSDLAAAVRGASARASETPAWWRKDLDGCGTLTPQPSWMVHKPVAYTGGDYVYYDETDAVARDLAERVVALAAMDTTQSSAARSVARALPRDASTPLAARGIESPEFPMRLLRGDGFAFITSVSNPVPDSCGSARQLLLQISWLAYGGPLADAIIPLVDTRAYVILAHREVGVSFDMYGTLRVLEPGHGLP